MGDSLGNEIAKEGVDICFCGCKYWERDKCIDCGTSITVVKNSDCRQCEWTNIFKSSQDGSREATLYNHQRIRHPDHEHVFADWKPFDWMKTPQSYCTVKDCLVSESDLNSKWK